ncbi:MAG: hypothetical protein AAGG56_05555 [Pseudomonadota bacterium]
MKAVVKDQSEDGLLVLIALTVPEIARVCEGSKSEFENFAKGSLWFSGCAELFSKNQLFALQLLKTPLVGGNHCVIGGVNDPIHKLRNLRIDIRQAAANNLRSLRGLAKLRVPCALEHIPHHDKERVRRFQPGQKRCELPFDLVALDGFAIRAVALLEAHVVWVACPGLALGPAGRQRVIAFGTDNCAPQWEILV